jgi:hypothetical protein
LVGVLIYVDSGKLQVWTICALRWRTASRQLSGFRSLAPHDAAEVAEVGKALWALAQDDSFEIRNTAA